jgi:hypothetical protein
VLRTKKYTERDFSHRLGVWDSSRITFDFVEAQAKLDESIPELLEKKAAPAGDV